MTVPDPLLALAPADLPLQRTTRFDGSEFSLPLTAFAPDEQHGLSRIYAAVNGLYRLWQSSPNPADFAPLKSYLGGLETHRLVAEAGQLGAQNGRARAADPRVRKLLHDIRGGGLAVLIGTADLIRDMPGHDELVRHCVTAARDHAKIMRAAIPDLDPVAHAADEQARLHTTAGFVSAWDGLALKHDGAAVSVAVNCSYDGGVTARCLETATIDRVVYNLVNNACRFAADGRVTLWIFPVGSGLVRWVVQNAITPDQRDWLLRTTGGDVGRLFAGGLTRGGTGVGLANCVEIVSACFGVGPEEALRDRHIGAKVEGTEYLAWFHWPVFPAGLENE